MNDQLKLISKTVISETSLTFSSSEIDELEVNENKTFSDSIQNLILAKLTQKFSNKCVGNGFVIPNEMKLIRKSEIYFPHEALQMSYKVDIEFSSLIVNPDVGSELKMKIEMTNKIGFLGTLLDSPMSPLIFLCPKDLTQSKNIFETKAVGDVVVIKVIGSKFEQNDKKITVIAEIVDEESKDP